MDKWDRITEEICALLCGVLLFIILFLLAGG
jgi:hypothetical protein